MEFPWNPNTNCAEKPQSSIPTRSFSNYFFFQKYLNLQVRTNKICIHNKLVYSTKWGKFFQFIVFIFVENALNLWIFIHALVPYSKLQAGFFENLFPPRRMGWRELWFSLTKFNQKIWRWLGTLGYLYFVWFITFLNGMTLQFRK